MGIEIKPSEIEKVDELGTLDGEKIKLVKTKGGLYLAIGKARKQSNPEVLAAGSHPAIVRHNIQKSFAQFQASMMKSEELGTDAEVAELSDLLLKSESEQGFGLYVVKKHNTFDIILTKNEEEVISCQAMAAEDDLILFKSEKLVHEQAYPFVPAIAKAAALIALDENKTRLIHANKAYKPTDILEKK